MSYCLTVNPSGNSSPAGFVFAMKSMSKTPLANARTVTSRSSKLNYVLKEA